MPPERRALIVEDLPDTGAWLAAVLVDAFGPMPIAIAENLRAARRWLREEDDGAGPLLALVDLGLPDGSGLELIGELHRDRPGARVVVSTVLDDDAHLLQALAAGAEGYLLKYRDRAELVELLQRLDRDEAAISPTLARRILERFRSQARAELAAPEPVQLTERETEVLRLIGRGLILREVAHVLGVSTHTVAHHVKSIYAKLGIASRAEAALEAAAATSPDPPRRPAASLLAFTYAVVGGAALIVLALLHAPETGVRFAPAAGGIDAVIDGGGRIVGLADDAEVTFSGRAGRVSFPAAELVPDFLSSGDVAEVKCWWAERARLRSLSEGGPLTISVSTPGGRAVHELKRRPRRAADLPADVWLLLAQGVAVGVLGAWILAMRPRDLAARMFAVACGGAMAAGFSGALFDGRDMAAGGGWPWAADVVNLAASCVCAAGLTGLFLVQPRRLIRWRTGAALAVAGAAWGAAAGVGLLPLVAFYIWVLGSLPACAMALLIQWRLSRGRPEDRAVLLYVGAVTLAGMSLLITFMAGPPLLGGPPPRATGGRRCRCSSCSEGSPSGCGDGGCSPWSGGRIGSSRACSRRRPCSCSTRSWSGD